MKVYFVTTGLWEEIQVLKKVRPPRLLCSYWYFRHRPLAEFCDTLGYRPEIILDSGAYSAYTKGKNVNLLDYMAYIKANKESIFRYISLDVIGDALMTALIYDLMLACEMRPVPVVHYGPADKALMSIYKGKKPDMVALGGTVPVRDKSEVVQWCKEMQRLNPSTSLHLLGSCSPKLLQDNALASCDASSWYIQAVKGFPSTIPGTTREAKMARAEANLRQIMETFDEIPIFTTDSSGEPADS